MILKIDRQQRNYNFLEIIKGFNSALDKYGKQGEMDNMYSFNFNPIGTENAEKIYDALSPTVEESENDIASLDLFYKDNGKYYFSKDKKIKPVNTREEVAVIYSMLLNGDFDLYLDINEKENLKSNINAFFDNLGEHTIDIFSYIDNKGKSILSDNLAELKPIFHTIKKAIELNQFLKITYNKDKCVNFEIQPIRLIFSQLDERIRVSAFSSDGICRTYYLSYIQDIKILKTKPFEPFSFSPPKLNILKFSFKNHHNLPERIAARFSNYKKEIRYNKNNNTITYTIEYEDNPKENSRILNRLLSVGNHISIQTSEKELIKQEAQKALSLYK